LAQQEIIDLAHRIIEMTSAPMSQVKITNSAYMVTRIANGQVLAGNDGDILSIYGLIGFSGEQSQAPFSMAFNTNQLDDRVLHAIARQCEALDRERVRYPENAYPIRRQVPDTLVPVQLWHEDTVQAMRTVRTTLLPQLITPVTKANLIASGFAGFVARSEVYSSRQGITTYSEETDCEVNVTAYSPDWKYSGWSGQAARNWTRIDPDTVATNAITMAKRAANPVALEPGRRTAILSATAVGQIAHAMVDQFRDGVMTGFIPKNNRVRWGERYFDPRITISSNPADPDGGYRPYFEEGFGTPAMTWIENGRLRNLANTGVGRGKPYSDLPHSMRISGGPTSVEEMIAQCEEGIYVNRFYGVEVVDPRVGLMTGVTRDGCFFIKNGKINKPVKNFRFLDSPFFFFNRVEALGPTHRVALGYTPTFGYWPLQPIIAPPMMVHDFNFNSLSDAV
jgi:predicted Zn-dependent protease